jgi:phosphatidylglycerophosphate synthase
MPRLTLPAKSQWPNILTGARLVLLPVALAAALAGRRDWFGALLAVAVSTDAVDGYLARRFNACTEFGRKFDSLADHLAMAIGVAGVAMLWPEIVRREWPWIVTLLVAYFALSVYGLLRMGRAPCYHTWASKTLAWVSPLWVVPLLAGWSAVPFHVAALLEVAAGLDGFAIVFLVPRHVGGMPTAWHAWKLRQATPV